MPMTPTTVQAIKGQNCPPGYTFNNGMCVPSGGGYRVPTAIAAVKGTCPKDYRYDSKSGYCTCAKSKPPNAHPRVKSSYDNCPEGYRADGHFCTEVVKGKVICNYFYQNGLLSKKLWELDEAYGENLSEKEPLTIIGYHFWAIPFVAEMEKKSTKGKIYLAVAKLLVPHWAKHLAGEKTFRGLTLHFIGKPICNLLGRVIIKTSPKSIELF